MEQHESEKRLRIWQIGRDIAGFELDEDQLIALGEELIALSGVCSFCNGDGQDGDPPDANGEGGWIGPCSACNGTGFVPANGANHRQADGLPADCPRALES